MAEVPTLAARLDRLFVMRSRPGERELSNEVAAAAITAATGTKISGSTLWALRAGRKTNPTLDTLRAIAAYFEVPAGYFLDDAQAIRIDAELELVAAMRRAGVKDLAVRAAELSPESLAAITAMVNTVSKAEGRGQRRKPSDDTPTT